MPRKNARVDAFVLQALRLNPAAPKKPKTAAEQQKWVEQRAVIAKHRMHARAARQQARYDVDALETAAYHDAEAERLEDELEAAGHLRPRGARYRRNPMQTLEQLEALAAHVHAGRAPVDVLESAIAEHVSRESMHKEAVEHGAALVDALNETPGAPRANLWTKAGVRVYFAGDSGYVTVGHDGSIGGAAAVPGRRRQSLTFSPEQLYPAQRRAYAQALDRYRAGIVDRAEEHAQERMARIDELRVAFGLAPFAEEDVEALERAAERAAWQAAHEEGRGNPSRRRRNARDPGDWVTIEDAAYDDEVDDWVTIEECACSSCAPMRLNPPKRKATGAYADLDSIVPVIAEALAKHGLTMQNVAEVKFTRGGKSRAGTCSYSPSTRQCKIAFNGLAWPAFAEASRLNTVLHEAAHAIQFLTTGNSDHGPAWQRIARSIGCTGDRCMSAEASQAMVDAYSEAKGLPKRKVITRESAMEASADFAVGDYVSFDHKRERWAGKIVSKGPMHATVMIQSPRQGITGKIPYPSLQKEAPPRFAEKVAGVDKPAPGESLSAWQARTGRGRENPEDDVPEWDEEYAAVPTYAKNFKRARVPVSQIASPFMNPVKQERIDELAALEDAGHILPPIIVDGPGEVEDEDYPEEKYPFLDGHYPVVGEDVWYVHDGHHRTMLAIQRGERFIDGLVME